MKYAVIVLCLILLIPGMALAEFSQESGVFDPSLAERTLTIASGCGDPVMQKGLLSAEGYDMVGAYNHVRSSNDTRHVAAYNVFEKALEDGRTEVIIAVRGTGNGEWALNVDMMPSGNYDLAYAENFALAAEDILKTHEEYFNGLSAPVFLVTGYSRGAAVANILAAKLTDRYGAESVFGYTFATPRTVRGDYPAYGNIFNIVNPADIITYLPLPQWGFERYGTDIVLPVDDESLLDAAKAAYRTMPGHGGVLPVTEGGSASAAALAEAFAALQPDLSSFKEKHAFAHPGIAEEDEAGMTGEELAYLFFTGGLYTFNGTSQLIKAMTQSENDFTPFLQAASVFTAGGGWHQNHMPPVYGAWLKAAYGE